MKKSELVERLVAMLESHLDHAATVRHDVAMPDLTDPGSTRQCDVVVETGPPGRRTTTIVEVQARKKKPDLDHFKGWIKKMADVGAQHLIAVNLAGYSKKQRRIAKRIGPAVRLVQFKDDPAKIIGWLGGAFGLQGTMSVVTYNQLKGLTFETVPAMRIDPEAKETTLPNPHEPYFSWPNGQPVTPSELFDQHLFRWPKNIQDLIACIEVDGKLGQLIDFRVDLEFDWDQLSHTDFGGTKVNVVRVSMLMNLKIDRLDIDWSGESYQQVAHGELGWILRGSATVPGGAVEIAVPFKAVPGQPGAYRMGRPRTISGPDAFIQVADRGYAAQPLVPAEQE